MITPGETEARLRSNRRTLVFLFLMAATVLTGGIVYDLPAFLLVFEGFQVAVWAVMIQQVNIEIRQASRYTLPQDKS